MSENTILCEQSSKDSDIARRNNCIYCGHCAYTTKLDGKPCCWFCLKFPLMRTPVSTDESIRNQYDSNTNAILYGIPISTLDNSTMELYENIDDQHVSVEDIDEYTKK